jgi:hypothetical protein
MQYGFFSSKSEGFRRNIYCLKFLQPYCNRIHIASNNYCCLSGLQLGVAFYCYPLGCKARRVNPLNSPKGRIAGRSRRVTMLEYHVYFFQSRAWLHTHHTRRRSRRYRLMSDTNMLTPVVSIGHKPKLHTHFYVHADTCDIRNTT